VIFVNGLPDHIRVGLFDLDGVLTPTALVHAAAWAELFDEFLSPRGERPFDPVHDYDQYVDGKPRSDGARDFLRSRGIDLPEGKDNDPGGLDTIRALGARKDEIFNEKIKREGVAPYPGSVAYLRAVRAAGLRTAVVSASKHCAEIVRAAGLEDLLDVRVDGVVAADANLPGKPHPATYLEAARRLGAAPEHATVFEDAVAGVKAGRAGHFGYVVGVDRVDHGEEHAHADELGSAGADILVRDLAELIDADGDGFVNGSGERK
jgi:HAD superfamily hydrolase (TIGR01509 family)